MAEETEPQLYDSDGNTPSQKALDASQRGQEVLGEASRQGQLTLARTQVAEALAEGANKEVGRELLGRLDALAADQGNDDAAAVYAEFKGFISSRRAGASQPAPASTAPASRQAVAKRAPGAVAAQRANDNKRLLDRSTPMSEIREIRARQRKEEGW